MSDDREHLRKTFAYIFTKLLVWHCLPERRTPQLRQFIADARREVDETLCESPELMDHGSAILKEAYAQALPKASKEIGIPVEDLPETCPLDVFGGFRTAEERKEDEAHGRA